MCNEHWWRAFPQKYRWQLLEGFLRFGIFVAKELARSREKLPRCRILMAVGTQNNYRSAEPVARLLPDASIFSFHNYSHEGLPRLNLARAYLTGAAMLPTLPLMLASEPRPHVRRAMKMRLDQFVLSFGSRSAIRRALRESGAEVLVTFSNLSVYSNLLVEEAKLLGITTVFMTHAPVGRGQVPLNTDYALLDGEFQVKLYPPGNTRTFVTGSMRGKLLSRHWQDRSCEAGILVATNTMIQDLGLIAEFIRRLSQRYPHRPIVIRPHPRDSERFAAHRRMSSQTGASYCDPRQPLHLAAEGCKYLVTAVSGVVVDAALIGLYPLFLRDPDIDRLVASLPADYYGLYELNLAKAIQLTDPELPEDWDLGNRVRLIEASQDPDWHTEMRIQGAFEHVLAKRGGRVGDVQPTPISADAARG